MVPLWFFSAVLLSSALGIPVFPNDKGNEKSVDDLSSNTSSLPDPGISDDFSSNRSSFPRLDMDMPDDFSYNRSSVSRHGGLSMVMPDDFSSNRSSVSRHGRLSMAMAPFQPCPISICSIHELDRVLQKGDEKAGNKVHDPFGPGKK